MTNRPSKQPQKQRIKSLDHARGIAIIAMIIFHFTWDLELFGHVERGLTATFEWKTFARAIASSFLTLAGVSLVLAHDPIIRLKSFLTRLIMLILAAGIISMATYYAMPGAPIFFGILHSIAAASVIGLFLRRLPPLILFVIAIGVFLAPFFLRSDIFDAPALWWVGLNANIPISNDYVPILPWLAPFLIGMVLGKIGKQRGFFEHLATTQSPPKQAISKLLAFMGRHGLVIYLIHQPILLLHLWLYSEFIG